MKLKDITEWSPRWSTPLGTMEANEPVADGVLVDLSLWGTSIIGLAINACCVDQFNPAEAKEVSCWYSEYTRPGILDIPAT